MLSFKRMFELMHFALLIYYFPPILVAVFPCVLRPFLFLNFLQAPYFMRDFNNFESYNISSTKARNFFLSSDDSNISLGIWQILPKGQVAPSPESSPDEAAFMSQLLGKEPIFLYLHGNGNNRGQHSRTGVYKLLSDHGCHVFAFDYRGYGDSSGHPIDESGFVADSLSVLRHIREYAPESPIIVYGHSLGTGVAGSLFKELQKLQQTDLIQGILLDAPFDIFVNGVTHYPLSMIFKFVIGYQNIMHRALFSLKIHFNTVHNLKTARIPIAIVHSEDDFVIPFHLGESLYEKLLASSVPVTFHNFGSNGYGHKYNHLAPEMNKVVSEWQILLLRNLMARLMAVRDPFYQ